jgi:hypothetical protein
MTFFFCVYFLKTDNICEMLISGQLNACALLHKKPHTLRLTSIIKLCDSNATSICLIDMAWPISNWYGPTSQNKNASKVCVFLQIKLTTHSQFQ